MIKNGSIPENITIVSNGKSKPYRWWDLGNKEVDLLVTKAYAVDSSSANMVKSAKQWAERLSDYNTESCTYVRRNELKIEEVENTPITGVKVLGLEHRGNSGRVYKIITSDGYYFDLKEEVLLDTILNEGIFKGGELGGSFVWGKVGSQMKLVRVGSELHSELNKAGERRNLKKVGTKELKVGGLYENKSSKKAIFLGWVSTIKICGNKTYSSNYFGSNYIYNFSAKDIGKAMLWCNIYGYDKKQKPYDEFTKWLEEDDNPYIAEIKTSHAMVREIEVFNIPSQIFNIINDMAVKYALNYVDRDGVDRKFYNMCHYSDLINMVPYGKTPKVHMIFNGLRL
ncbi:MAG: hypothetical protein WC516_04420 [Patescibacteria group bacterium]|jgi:hypothetical protein